MVRTELENAAATLQEAADTTDSTDASDRLRKQSEQLEQLSVADRGPDHGRLARHEHILTDIAADVDDDVAEQIESALDSVREFRATVEGV